MHFPIRGHRMVANLERSRVLNSESLVQPKNGYFQGQHAYWRTMVRVEGVIAYVGLGWMYAGG